MTAISPDWISAISGAIATVIAGCAAWFGLKTFNHQKTSQDVTLSLGIFSEINRYWDQLVQNPGQSTFYYGQILAHFEVACALFNRGILSEAASSVLKDHIIEVFTQFQSTEEGRALLENCRSSTETFDEIRKFSANYFPQQLRAISFPNSDFGR